MIKQRLIDEKWSESEKGEDSYGFDDRGRVCRKHTYFKT